MKKTLIAVAALSAMAASAMAADATLYGQVDAGLRYTKTQGAASKTEMTHNNGSSRWGIKASDDLGNGYKAIVQLEGGFKSDTGKVGKDGYLFERIARAGFATPYGTVQFGQGGTITGSTCGGLILGQGSPMGASYGNLATTAIYYEFASHVENMVQYDSPNFAGFQATLQYSNDISYGKGKTSEARFHDSDTYAGAVLQYTAGGLNVRLGVNKFTMAEKSKENTNPRDDWTAPHKRGHLIIS